MTKSKAPDKLRHLDTALKIFKAPKPPKSTANMRPQYESALQAQGWELLGSGSASSIWRKEHKRMLVENGDKLMITFDNIRWTPLNPSARQRLLLHSQV